MLNMVANFIMLYFISTKNNNNLTDALGLGLVFSNCTVIVFIYSLDQGLNALIAAAAGAKDSYLIGLYYQRGLFLLMIFVLPLLSLLFFSSSILQVLGIDEEIANITQQYTRAMAPSCIATALFDASRALLIGQNIFYPILYIQLFTTLCHYGWCYLFVETYDLALEGVGIARIITESTNFFMLILYIKLSGRIKSSWIPWTLEALDRDGLKAFIKIATPIGAILFLDWVCYEIFTIIAGHFDSTQLVIHVAIANTSTLFYNLFLGLGVSAMTFIANSLGANCKTRAKNYAVYSLIINILMVSILAPILYAMRNIWASLFSNVPSTQQDLIDVFYVYLVGVLIMDSFQVILAGILKGIGKQKLATYGVLISFYFMAIPLIIYLSIIRNWQVMGIWVGFSIVICLLVIFFVIVLLRSDWDEQLKIIKARLLEEKGRINQ